MSSAISLGSIFELIYTGRAGTRAEITTATGLTRATVSQRVETLISSGLVRETDDGISSGGRRPMVLRFNENAGVFLAADLGATHCRLAVSDLSGRPVAETSADLDISYGPDVVLDWVRERFMELLEGVGWDKSGVWGIGIGLPGPVDFARGQAISPPIMPGWDRVSIPERISEDFGGAPVLVDNDVNIMALGEQRVHWPEVEHLLFVKVGTGIGCGVVVDGDIHRGAQGSAGDMGHIRISGHEDALCRCGNVACVEAVAGGWALAQQLSGLGFPAITGRDVVDLVQAGNPAASRMVRTAGEMLGEVLASSVNFFNPGVIVIGGDMAHAHEQLFAGIRSVIYHRSPPLATRYLELVPSKLDDRAGIRGAALMLAEHVLRPESIETIVAGRMSSPEGEERAMIP